MRNTIFQFIDKALILIVIGTISTVFILSSCNKGNGDPSERPKPGDDVTDSLKILPEGSEASTVSVNTSVQYQAIDNFAASDCWGVQYVGKWPVSKREAIADWLFSLDTTNNGQPLGIGLSAWRFNIGAGSSEQGPASGIGDEWRRSECFRDPSGNYNWGKQLGQQWFLMAAKERGVEQFIGFSNSPPVHFTKNGKAYGEPGDQENISGQRLPDFTGFLVEVIEGLKTTTGVELDYISPVNEPQWDWTSGSQEGCHYQSDLYGQLVEILDQKIGESGLSSEILVSEAAKWSYLYGNGSGTGNQIDFFFGPEGVGINTPALAPVIAGHSYHSTTPLSTLINERKDVWNKASTIDDLKVWATEYCPLGAGDLNALGWNNWHVDLTMDVALYVARILHYDLVLANASAWQWWLSVSPYDYPDGLVYVSKNKVNGTYTDSKLMWAIGNFSRFVRPGSIRVKADCLEDEVYVTGFVLNNALQVVVINYGESVKPLRLELAGTEGATARPYITSDKDYHKLHPMKPLDIDNAFEMPARSIITFSIRL